MTSYAIYALAALTLLSATVYADQADEDWKTMHYKVYATEGSPLKVEETQELLKQLQSLYSGRTDEGSIGRKMRVDSLLRASQVSTENCERNYMTELNQLIQHHESYELNLIPYLKHWRSEQYKLCKDVLVEEEKKAASALSDDDRQQVVEFINRCLEARRCSEAELEKPYVSRKSLMEGLLAHLKSEGFALDRKTLLARGYKKYSEQVESSVGATCRRVRKVMTPLVYLYKQFDEALVPKIDGFSLTWVAYERICRDFLYESSLITELTYKFLTDEKRPKAASKKGGFFTFSHCLLL